MDEEPGEEAGDPSVAQAVEAHDRAAAADDRRAPDIAVPERLALRRAAEAPPDRPRDVDALLQRDLGDAGEPVERHRVADDEHLRVARHRAVGGDGDPAGAIALGSGRLGQDARER